MTKALTDMSFHLSQSLVVQDISAYLISMEAIPDEELERIEAEKTRRDRATELIRYFRLHAPVHQIWHFIDAIEIHYPWLHENLMKKLHSGDV